MNQIQSLVIISKLSKRAKETIWVSEAMPVLETSFKPLEDPSIVERMERVSSTDKGEWGFKMAIVRDPGILSMWATFIPYRWYPMTPALFDAMWGNSATEQIPLAGRRGMEKLTVEQIKKENEELKKQVLDLQKQLEEAKKK